METISPSSRVGRSWIALRADLAAQHRDLGAHGGGHIPKEAAEELHWGGPEAPGEGRRWVVRRFRDGHEGTWWAADLRLAGYGPDQRVRLVAATTNPATLRERNTWYLITNLPRPGSDQASHSPSNRPTWQR